jgi:hypothetical protein
MPTADRPSKLAFSPGSNHAADHHDRRRRCRLGIGGFLYLFKREAVADLADGARGYPRATSPQQCVDQFKKAVKERRYTMAARYCTRDYAEQLTRGAEAGEDLGEAIDDLTHRMRNDGVLTSEIEYVLFLTDPLPPDLKLTIQTSTDTEATAAIGVDNPALLSAPTKTWKFDPWFVKAFYADHPRGFVRLVKKGDHWFIDVPVSPEMRNRVDRLIDRHRDYVNALKKMSEEVRIDRTTKAEVSTRLEELLNDAVTAAK